MSAQSQNLSVEAMLAEGMRYHEGGRIDRAERIYREVLAREPANGVALISLGRIHQEKGSLRRAISFFKKALAQQPDSAVALTSLAAALGELGRYAEAEKRLRKVLSAKPNFVPAWTTLGNVLEAEGRLDDAVGVFEKALQLRPDHPRILNNLAVVLVGLGRLSEAEEHYNRILGIDPDSVEALTNLGMLAARRNEYKKALDLLGKALERDPQSPELLVNLGDVLRRLGEYASAQELFARALSTRPKLKAARSGLVMTLARAGLDRYQPSIDRLLTNVFSWDDVAFDDLAPLVARHLILKHRLIGDDSRYGGSARMADLAGDHLLRAALGGCPLLESDFAPFLARLRGNLLKTKPAALIDDTNLLALLGAVALQCHAGSYRLPADPDEVKAAEELFNDLESVTDWSAPSVEAQAALLQLAMYRDPLSLSRAAAIGAVSANEWQKEVQGAVVKLVSEPLEEQALAEALPDLTPQDSERGKVSDKPISRWLSLPRPDRETLGASLKALFPDYQPAESLSGAIDILAVNCGTGWRALSEAALLYREASVLAVDPDRLKLAYGARRARDLDVPNISFARADPNHIGRIERHFHMIDLGRLEDMVSDVEEIITGACTLLIPGGILRIPLPRARAGADKTAELLTRIASAVRAQPVGMIGIQTDAPAAAQAYTAAFPDDLNMRELDHWTALIRERPSILGPDAIVWIERR